MTKAKFLIFVLAISFFKFLFLPVLGWEFPVEPLAVFVITYVLISRNAEKNFWLISGAIILFDIFSGGFFGSLTVSVASGIFLVFLIRKFLLIYAQNYFVSFVSIFVSCLLYKFVLIKLEMLPLERAVETRSIIYMSMAILTFYLIVYVLEQKRISSVQL